MIIIIKLCITQRLPQSKGVNLQQIFGQTTLKGMKPNRKPNKTLKGKQVEFVRELIENPKQPAYKAAKAAGYKGNDNTLRSIASENLTKPNIQLELAKYSNKAEIVLLEVLETSREQMLNPGITRAVDWAVNARQTADSILDRVHGKATTKIEQTSRAVVINIDLTSAT